MRGRIGSGVVVGVAVGLGLLASISGRLANRGPPTSAAPVASDTPDGVLPFEIQRGGSGDREWILAATFVPDRGKVCLYLTMFISHETVGGGCFWIEGTPSEASAPKVRERLTGYDIVEPPWATKRWPDTQTYLLGVASATVDTVELRSQTGESRFMGLRSRPWTHGLRFFVAVLEPEFVGAIIAKDQQGKVVEQQEIDAGPGLGPGALPTR